MKVGKSIAGRCAQSGLPIRLADAYADSRFEQSDDKRSGQRTGSLARRLKSPPPLRPWLARSRQPQRNTADERPARCPREGGG